MVSTVKGQRSFPFSYKYPHISKSGGVDYRKNAVKIFPEGLQLIKEEPENPLVNKRQSETQTLFIRMLSTMRIVFSFQRGFHVSEASFYTIYHLYLPDCNGIA